MSIIHTEHGTYALDFEPGYVAIYVKTLNPITLKLDRHRIGTVRKPGTHWFPESIKADGTAVKHPMERTRKAAVARIISGYEQEARREAALAEAKQEGPNPAIAEVVSVLPSTTQAELAADLDKLAEARQAMASGIAAGVAEFEAESCPKTGRSASVCSTPDHSDCPPLAKGRDSDTVPTCNGCPDVRQ